jgi:integrase
MADTNLYRRGRTWWARVQRNNAEFRRSLKTTNKVTARNRLGTWLKNLDATEFGEKPRRSFEEVSERFIKEHLTAIKPKAATRYGVSLKNLSLHFGTKYIHEITPSALADFETARRSQGVTPSTIRRDLWCLSSMLTSCEDWEWIEDGSNFIPRYLRRRAKRGLKEGNPRTRYLTVEEEKRLLAATTEAVGQAITLAIETGLRLDELFSLQWWQVDAQRGIIQTTTRTKNGKARMVPLTKRSAQILAQLKRYDSTPFVLVNPDTKTRYVQMTKGLKAAMRRANIADFRWHDLRRTAGCRWLQRDGKSMAEVCILLGHSSIQVTEKSYAFLDAEATAQSLSGATEAGTKAGTGTADHAA